MSKKTTKAKSVKKLDADKNEPTGAPKVFDVAKPSEITPDATARPVIVGHGPMIKQDPMMVDSSETTQSKPQKSKKITPISDSDSVLDEAKNAVDESVESAPLNEATPATEESKNSIAVELKPETDEHEDMSQKPDEEDVKQNEITQDTEVTEDVSETEPTHKAVKDEEAKLKEEADRADKVKGLIDSKKYFVSTHQGPGGSSAGSWVLLILLLLIVGAYLAIDAGLVDIGVQLPINFIQN